MTDDRKEVMRLVLAGELSADHVTREEITELEEIIMELIIEKKAQNNPMVFSGIEGRLTQ